MASTSGSNDALGSPATARVDAPLLVTDPSILWHPVSADSILYDDTLRIWNSGHVNAILKLSADRALVGTDTGGVWSLAWSSTSAAAVPLSERWNSVNISSLAPGPDAGAHVYAGTVDKGDGNPGAILWESDTSAVDPLGSWVPHDLRAYCGSINHILVINEFRRIVVACDTGVWWSPIPSPPAAEGAYSWLPAVPGTGVSSADIHSGAAPRQGTRLDNWPGVYCRRHDRRIPLGRIGT